MSNATGARTVGIFMVLSLVLAGAFLFPAGASVEGMANLKVLVKNQKEENIEEAKVSCVNVHTGSTYTLAWNAEEGWFEADVVPGTYQVFASSEGFVTPSKAQMVYKIDASTDDTPAIIISLTRIGEEGMAKVHVTNDGNELEGAVVHLFGANGAHLTAKTTPKGYANISCPEEELHLLVFSKNLLTHSSFVDIEGTKEINVTLTKEPATDAGSFRVMGLVMNGSTLVAGIKVYIWDGPNGHLVPHDETEDGALSLPLYGSNFSILIEADGYEAYWLPDVDLSKDENYYRPYENTFEMKKVKNPSTKVTKLDMSGEKGISEPVLTTKWTMDANSRLYGTWNTFGNPRMQSSALFFTVDDWFEVTESEEMLVQAELLKYGPAWMETTEFINVNGQPYSADTKNYTVDVEGLAGEVLEENNNPVVDMMVPYMSEIEYEEDDDLRIEVFTVLEDETVEIILPSDYEILGDFGEKASFPNSNTSRLVVKEPLEFNAKVKEAPTAKLAFSNANKHYKVEAKKYIVKINSNITLTGKDSKDPVGDIVEYNWDLPQGVKIIEGKETGDEESSKEVTFHFTANSVVFHNITLWVRDSSGLKSKEDWIYLMPDNSPPTILNYTLYDTEKKVYLAMGYKINEDIQIEFNASEAKDNVDTSKTPSVMNGVIADYIWSFSDGSGTLNGEVVKHRFADPGTFDISLKLIDAVGNMLNVTNRTIQVKDTTKPLPVIVVSLTEVKIGSKVQLNGSQSYDPRTTGKLYDALVNYTWQMYQVGKNYTVQTVIGYGKVVNYTFTEPGNWILNLTVTDENGLVGWYEKTQSVGGPDLQAEAITFVKPEANKLRAGDNAKISVRIRNNGLVDTPKNTTWYIKVTMNGKTIKNESIDLSIGAGKTSYYNFSYTIKEKGSKEFEVHLDVTKVIKETEETNNNLKTEVTVKEAEPWFRWWYVLILVVIILVIYVAFMKVSRQQWGYEPIVELWKKYMG